MRILLAIALVLGTTQAFGHTLKGTYTCRALTSEVFDIRKLVLTKNTMEYIEIIDGEKVKTGGKVREIPYSRDMLNDVQKSWQVTILEVTLEGYSVYWYVLDEGDTILLEGALDIKDTLGEEDHYLNVMPDIICRKR